MVEEWDRETFSRWLRMQRRVLRPMSQQKLAELLEVSQSKVSRWEAGNKDADPPTLSDCSTLSEVFEVDFIELAKLCGWWNDQIERRVLVSLASADSDVSQAPVAQLNGGSGKAMVVHLTPRGRDDMLMVPVGRAA